MSGHGEKLTRKQDAAIGALLSQSTISAAAESVGIGEATLRPRNSYLSQLWEFADILLTNAEGQNETRQGIRH